MFSHGDTYAKKSWATRQGEKKARAVASARATTNQIPEKDISVVALKYYTKRDFLKAFQCDKVAPGIHEKEKEIIMDILHFIAKALVAAAHVVYLITGAMDYAGLELMALDPAVVHDMYTNAFIAYAVSHIVFELLPKLAKAAWALLKKIWSMLR